MNLEFEYAATNGDLTVDKIIHRRKRKRVINLDSKDIETMGKYKAADHAQKRYDKRINAARDEKRRGLLVSYYAPQPVWKYPFDLFTR